MPLRAPVPYEWQVMRGARVDRIAQLDAVRDPVVRDSLVPLVECTTQLEAGQVRTQATVPATGEADVRIGGPVRTYRQRVVEHLFVDVRRRPPPHGVGPGCERAARQLHVL